MPRHARATSHVCPRCGESGHTSRECCHLLMWCVASLKASVDLYNVHALCENEARSAAGYRDVQVTLPVIWGNYAVTAEVLSFLSWNDALAAVASVNRSAHAAFNAVFGRSVRTSTTSVHMLAKPLSMGAGIHAEPLSAWAGIAIAGQLSHQARLNAARLDGDDAASDAASESGYCPSDAPSNATHCSRGHGGHAGADFPWLAVQRRRSAVANGMEQSLHDADGRLLCSFPPATTASLHALRRADSSVVRVLGVHRSYRQSVRSTAPEHWPEEVRVTTAYYRLTAERAVR